MPAPDDFNYADLDLDDGWDPMQCYDRTVTAAAASAMKHSTDTLLASCGAQPQHAQPQNAQPKHAQPQHAQPQHAQPQHAQPQHAQPQHAQPQHAQPQHAQPQHAQPQHAQPQHDHSVSTPAAAQHTTETRLPTDCSVQSQRYYSSSTPPAADGINPVEFQAFDCDGQQRFAGLPSAEARQVLDRGATATVGMKQRSHSENMNMRLLVVRLSAARLWTVMNRL